jgi:acyl-CoA hydrolase
MNKKRFVKDSQTTMTQLVLPNDTNRLGNLLGGRVMEWIDIAAAITAQRHSRKVCVTASVDELNFHYPIKQSEVVTLKASINRVFNTSIEIGVKVWVEDPLTEKYIHSNTAYLTFVAIDEKGRPISVPPVISQTKEEKRRFKEAGERRRLRLLHRKQN